MEYFFNLARLSIACSRSIQVACLCLILLFYSNQALATEDEYREKLLNEIRSSLSDKNKELAEQLVDIRIEEERKLGKKTLFQTVLSQKINLDDADKEVEKQNSNIKNSLLSSP